MFFLLTPYTYTHLFPMRISWHLCMSPILLQIIAEGANGPTTPEADKIFLERNIMVIPVGRLRSSVLYVLGIISFASNWQREDTPVSQL